MSVIHRLIDDHELDAGFCSRCAPAPLDRSSLEWNYFHAPNSAQFCPSDRDAVFNFNHFGDMQVGPVSGPSGTD
jgi:hypothetical protein